MKTSITPGQVKQASRLVSDAAASATETAIGQLAADGEINLEVLQRFLGKGDRLTSRFIPFLKQTVKELSEKIIGCVRCISEGREVVLEATDGKETIANARKVFTGYLDGDYESYGTNVPGDPAPAMKITVHEMVKDGDFKSIFGSFDAELDKLCIPQGQIIQFAQKQSEWLHPQGYATLFLFKVNGAFFVARVDRGAGKLWAFVYRFSFGNVWSAGSRSRVVVPQL